ELEVLNGAPDVAPKARQPEALVHAALPQVLERPVPQLELALLPEWLALPERAVPREEPRAVVPAARRGPVQPRRVQAARRDACVPPWLPLPWLPFRLARRVRPLLLLQPVPASACVLSPPRPPESSSSASFSHRPRSRATGQ